MGINWRPMLVLSLVLHLGVLLGISFIPEDISFRRFNNEVIYEVDIVDMPPVTRQPPKSKIRKNSAVIKKDTQTKRISIPEKKTKPLVISKRTSTRNLSIKKPEITPPKSIEKPVPKKETEVEPEYNTHIRDAIAKIQEDVSNRPRQNRSRNGASSGGIPMRIYQMEVETKITSNWSYPVALKGQKNLEAVVVLRVKRDGTILKYDLVKRSNDSIFDDSVMKAIERSGTMPPFPEGFNQNEEEIEIRFNLKDLKNS